MRTAERRVGGGEGIEGVYGSITGAGFGRVMEALARCGDGFAGGESGLVDVGAGLGRPLMHAGVVAGVPHARLRGIEGDPIKCQKAEAFMRSTLRMLRAKGAALGPSGVSAKVVGNDDAADAADLPAMECAYIEDVRTLDPATHVYSFWEGIPPKAKGALAHLFNDSATCVALAVVQRAVRNVTPKKASASRGNEGANGKGGGEGLGEGMGEGGNEEDASCTTPPFLGALGFRGISLVADFPVAMQGSGRQFRCYVCVKRGVPFTPASPAPPPPTPAPAAAPAPPLFRGHKNKRRRPARADGRLGFKVTKRRARAEGIAQPAGTIADKTVDKTADKAADKAAGRAGGVVN